MRILVGLDNVAPTPRDIDTSGQQQRAPPPFWALVNQRQIGARACSAPCGGHEEPLELGVVSVADDARVVAVGFAQRRQSRGSVGRSGTTPRPACSIVRTRTSAEELRALRIGFSHRHSKGSSLCADAHRGGALPHRPLGQPPDRSQGAIEVWQKSANRSDLLIEQGDGGHGRSTLGPDLDARRPSGPRAVATARRHVARAEGWLRAMRAVEPGRAGPRCATPPSPTGWPGPRRGHA